MEEVAVYGVCCTWRGKFSEAVVNSKGMIVCPHCGGVVFEGNTEEEYMAGVADYEEEGHSGYVAFMRWIRGKCYPSPQDAVSDFTAQTGKAVEL